MSEIESKPSEFEFEDYLTVDDRSYTVIVHSIRLKNHRENDNPIIFRNPDTLIKYSKEEHSPASSKPSRHLRLRPPSYYRNLEMKLDSELISDNLESQYIEKMKPNSYTQFKLTWGTDNLWMYCTSIDPGTNNDRAEQMKYLSVKYNFETKIESPSCFAKQLGFDFGKQIALNNGLKCDYPALYTIALFKKKNIPKYIIYVNHGPVIYTDKIDEYMGFFDKKHHGIIIPFVKRQKFIEQKEYRFCVYVELHGPKEEHFDLKVSDDLRNLIKPSEL